MKNRMADAVKLLREVKGKKVSISYHDDADGIMSAAQLIRLLHKLGASEIKREPTRVGPTADRHMIDDIVEWGADIAITVDFAGGLDALAQAMAKRGGKTLCIDHHIIYDYDFPKDTVYINPRLTGKPKPASAYVFELVNKFSEMKDEIEEILWMAASGTIGDFGVEEDPELVKRAIKKYPDLFEKKTLSSKVLRDTRYGIISETVSSATVWGDYHQADVALEAVLDSSDPHDIIERRGPNAKKIGEGLDSIKAEAAQIEKDYDEKHETHGKLFFYMFKSKKKLKSLLSTKLGVKYPKNVVMICQEGDTKIRCSYRCQDGTVDMDKTLRKALEGLSGTGGGHPKAAGSTVDKKDFEEFKKRLIELCN